MTHTAQTEIPDPVPRRTTFGHPVTLTTVHTPGGTRERCSACRALVCPKCKGCHCAAHTCTHTPHRCCGGGPEA